MSKWTLLLALIASLASAGRVPADTADVTKHGAVADDDKDDSPAFQAAFDAIAKTGGTILVPKGKFVLRRTVRLVATGGAEVSVILKGDGGGFCEVQLENERETVIYAGNLNRLTLENMIFVGQDGKQNNGGWVVTQGNVQQSRIVGCEFLGLQMTGGVIDTQKVSAVIDSCSFDGNAVGDAVVWAHDFRSLTVRDSQFIDFSNFRGRYLSKTPAGVGAWIKAENGLAPNAVGQRRVVIEDCSFDEGAFRTASFKNVAFVSIRGTAANLNGTDPGQGFHFDGVKHAVVEQVSFGYAKARRPAIVARNKSRVAVGGVVLSDGIEHFERDDGSQLEQKDSPAKIEVVK